MPLSYAIFDVFTDTPLSGNPLAIVQDADALTAAQMQKIAREFNLAETVFLQTPTPVDTGATALVRARIFTPMRELPFAGHPTVGTACFLAEQGIAPAGDDQRIVLELGIGPVSVRLRRAENRPVYAELTAAVAPEYGPTRPTTEAVATMLGLEPADLVSEGESVRTASCGMPFVLVPLRAPELLAAINLDVTLMQRGLAGQWSQQIYVYARGYEGELRARMFAPDLGIPEDPATGGAAVALAGALAMESPITEGRLDWVIHQGVEMGRPSQLHISADRAGGRVTAVRVGGHA
ncbi:MAG: PhzF family phenazine biosynthesis protein, partial [Pseudomonadota bacterium]|nr:PhzF family phenazine biosynthesis protein [Pseudomonadota bacterium]